MISGDVQRDPTPTVDDIGYLHARIDTLIEATAIEVGAIEGKIAATYRHGGGVGRDEIQLLIAHALRRLRSVDDVVAKKCGQEPRKYA